LERNEFIFEITESNTALFRGIYNEFKELHEMEGKDAVEFVLNQRKFDPILPEKIMLVREHPCEITQANAGIAFQDGDKMFTDVSTRELRQDSLPRSFSHGGMGARVKLQNWICNIYANERDTFKAHLIRQLMAAIEQLEKIGRKSVFQVIYSRNLAFDAMEVLKELPGFEQDVHIVTDCILVYETSFNKNKL
jgi:hypothetical protein